jgi:glycosidase
MMRFTNWNESEKRVWNLTRDWIALRKSRMSLMYGQSAYSLHGSAPGVLLIERTYLDEKTLILINTTADQKQIPLPTKTESHVLEGPAILEEGNVILAPNACAAIHIGQ